jgi:hypothetical protein
LIRAWGRRTPYDSNSAGLEVLLILQIRIGRHEHGKVLLLRRVEQLPILQLRPTPFKGGGNFVSRQSMTQRFRSPLIEKYAHLRRGERASCGMIEYGADLL